MELLLQIFANLNYSDVFLSFFLYLFFNKEFNNESCSYGPKLKAEALNYRHYRWVTCGSEMDHDRAERPLFTARLIVVMLIHTSDPADEKLLMWFGEWVTANRVRLWHFSFQSRDCWCYFQSAVKGIESLLDHNAKRNTMHCSKMALSVVQLYFALHSRV